MSLLIKRDATMRMGSRLSLLCFCSLFMIPSNTARAQPKVKTVVAEKPEPRLVFAHNHAYAPYGRTIEGYKQDMRDAQKAGIDGFAINYGRWDGENGYYKRKVAMFFQAAKELNTGFKLFLSPDGTSSGGKSVEDSLSAREVRDGMELYANHPNYWHYKGRPVLSAWHGGGQGEESLNVWKDVLEPLRAKGINPYFVPFFYVASYNESPDSYDEIKANFNGQVTNSRDFKPYTGWWSQVVDGMFSSAVAGLPVYKPEKERSVLDYGEAFAKVMHDNGKTYMASVAPYYWGQLQGTKENPNRRYFEYEGGKGLEAQWKSVIEKQKPEWIELFTWNDYTESTYFSPTPNAAVGDPSLGYQFKEPEFFPTHAGFLELNRYFTQWYKTGKKPAITEDKLFYFYRRHPKDAYSPEDPRGPVVVRHGDVQDSLYVTTMLTAPAELRVVSGGKSSNFNVGKGLVHTDVPFAVGEQHFELWRGKTRLLQSIGSPVTATAPSYNFHVTSGFASSKARPDLTITDVKAQPASDGSGKYMFSATVQNVGGAPLPVTATTHVEFVVESGEGSQTFLSNPSKGTIAAGKSVSIETPAGTWQPPAGTYRVWARVSAGKSVVEANDWNNTGTNGSSTVVVVGK